MPVSTFSSGNSAVRAGAHNGMIARWNSTRERMSSDEQRVSLNEINEMDGTGLYERPDWPLAESTFAAAHSKRPSLPENDADWERGNHHITDVNGSDWVVERDVSDVDEDESIEHLEEEAQDLHPEAVVMEDVKRHEIEIRQSRLLHARGNSQKGGSLRSIEGEVHHTDVSSPEVSPIRADFEEHSPRPSPQSWRERLQSTPQSVNGTRGISPPRPTVPDPQTPSTNSDGLFLDADMAALAEEERDTATPMSSEVRLNSIDLPYQSPSTRSPAQANGRVFSTGDQHVRASSIAKPPLSAPHSRQSSVYNPYNTTHIPHNRERVRYSWQSLQDDEPNRPRIHIIKLVSNTATASAGFPQGEAFGFSVSPGGRRIAAYNSARLYVLQTAALPVGISQDYALKRRPLAVELNDEGNVLITLADEHTVNVYDLSNSKLRRHKTIKLDFPSHCIAVAPCGGLLAAAYEGGVEVFSLAASALPTDRRAVRSSKMDRLAFSNDGSTLLGTTTRIHTSSTVVVNVPVFPSASNGIPTAEELKEAWCSELLHPENIRNSSHATFMREDRTTSNERMFAWNGQADTFGILDTSDMEYGQVDFPVVISPPLSTCGGLGAAMHTCPAIDEFGDTVAMIVNDRTIRLYIVPHRTEEDETPLEAHSIDHELDEGYGCPFSEVRWVYSHADLPAPLLNHSQVKGRLIVTSPGGVVEQGLPEESIQDVEGGRIILFDFDPQFAGQPGQTFSLTLGKSPPQQLEEEEYDVADEVALMRRRTVKQNTAGGLSQKPITLGRAATLNASRNGIRAASPALHSRRVASILSVNSFQSDANRSLPDVVETNEAIEEPFTNQAPRSQVSLQRAASNAQRHRFQTLEERNREQASVDNSGEFLPLPEYTEEPNAPLPGRFRALAGLDTLGPLPNRPAMMHTSNQVPMSAPPAMADSFSAEQAFIAANAALAAGQVPAGTPPASMPRGLLRAYSTAASHMRQGPAPALIGDWQNVSPSYPQVPQEPTTSPASAHRTPNGNRSIDEEWATVSPASTASLNSPLPRAQNYRYSTPQLNPLQHQTALPRRSTSVRRPEDPIPGTSRRQPVNAFRQAAATASLFPPTQPSNHVPLPTNRIQQSAGTVAHPILEWRPPAPSTAAAPAPGTAGRHSRKSSVTSKSAFASTAKARRLGFFKRGSRSSRAMLADGMGDMDDAKSGVTWLTTSERKCVVM